MATSAAERDSLIDAARALSPLIREYRDEMESRRQLPEPLVQAMTRAGFFRMWLPEALGGLEVGPETLVRVVEEIARIDGSAGWNVAFGALAGLFTAFLPERGAQKLLAHAPEVIVAGAITPTGRATVASGGYRVTGRWAFASGCLHSTWLIGNCFVYDGDTPRLAPDGTREMRTMWFPTEQCTILDTWDVGGMRGTGSHDFTVIDIFVPAELSCDTFTEPPHQPGLLYKLPRFSLSTVPVAAVCLGIARGAIDTLVGLARTKVPSGSRELLRERASVQSDVARAEMLVRPARAYLFSLFAELMEIVRSGTEISLEERAILRLASTSAAINAAQAVDLMYNAGGTSSIWSSNPLDRYFRDVHVATQNIVVAPMNYEMSGRVLLGMDPGTPRF